VTKLLKAVVDTNLIISAILSSRGASSKLIDWLTREEDYFRLVISQPIWDEYTTVADWLIPKSHQPEKSRVFAVLRVYADWIEPNITLDSCHDISDNRFLECAVSGNADYLVTKNIRHFPYKHFGTVRIVRISKFLAVLEEIEKLRQTI